MIERAIGTEVRNGESLPGSAVPWDGTGRAAAFAALLEGRSGPKLRGEAQERPRGREDAAEAESVLPTATSVAAAEIVSPAPVKPGVEMARSERVQPSGSGEVTQREQVGAGRNVQRTPADTPRQEATPAAAGAGTKHEPPATTPSAPPAASAAAARAPEAEPGVQTVAAAAAKAGGPAAAGAVAAAGAGAGGRGTGREGAVGVKAAPSPAQAARLLGALERAGGAQQVRRGVASSAQPPRPGAEPDPAAMEGQIGRGLAAVLRQGGGTVTLRLQPEALGDLKIRMVLEPGRVGASFEVGTPKARELLDKTMAALRSALEARGLDVEKLEIRVVDRAMDGAAAGRDEGAASAGGDGRGGAGWERPADGATDLGAGVAGMPPGPPDTAEAEDPGMGPVEQIVDAGGARVRIRLDAVA